MTKKQKQLLISIIITTLLVIINLLFIEDKIISFSLYLVGYLLVGFKILFKAIKNIFAGKVFDENFLMAIATIGAFATDQYFEGVLVMLLYQIGELFQSYATCKSRNSISSLMDIRPDYANVEIDGKPKKVDPNDVKIGDIIIVKAGEKIPLDGIVEKGSSLIDTSALTGESVPREVNVGDEVLSGCINKNGLLMVKVTKEFGQSTVSKILELVENASTKKAKSEKFITKFARYYTPIVVIAAVFLALIPPLLINDLTFTDCIKRAMTFLVISCPCALVISVPLGFFGGIGGASRNGILIKGSNYLETLSKVKTIVFDKTGTLTKGTFEVTKIESVGLDAQLLLEYAALAEAHSSHPIAESIKSAYPGEMVYKRVTKVSEVAGNGIEAKVDGKNILVGNYNLMEENKITVPKEKLSGTVVYISIDSKYAGFLLISDEIKEESLVAIADMKHKYGIETVMLTGDNYEAAKDIAEKLKINKFYASLLPNDKVNKVEELLENGNLAFVGDGINDAPVLTRADIGIAMGGLGSDAAIEAADIVIMDDNISKINTAISLSKRTIRIVKQNIWFSIGIKVFFLLLGAFGVANMMEAIFADVGVSIIAILNSMRTLKVNKF